MRLCYGHVRVDPWLWRIKLLWIDMVNTPSSPPPSFHNILPSIWTLICVSYWSVTIGMRAAALGPHCPLWLRKYTADNLSFMEYERKALPCALMRSTKVRYSFLFSSFLSNPPYLCSYYRYNRPTNVQHVCISSCNIWFVIRLVCLVFTLLFSFFTIFLSRIAYPSVSIRIRVLTWMPAVWWNNDCSPW